MSQTNRLLGYPDDARLLIINADDLGMCHAANAAIFRALGAGVLCSTTLMVPCPWARHAMQWLQENPDVPFGVHLTVIGDTPHYRYRPLNCRDHVPSLADETGHFYHSDRIPEFVAQAKTDEVEREFRAQIETVLAANLTPTHLDWHSLRIHQRPDIFDVMLKLARDYGLALRVRERPFIEKVQRLGLPCNDDDFLDSTSIATEGKPAHYARLLRDLPAGLSEWALHPALNNAEFRAIEPDGAAVRQADYDFLMSPEAGTLIQQEGIVLLSYKLLQQIWQAS